MKKKVIGIVLFMICIAVGAASVQQQFQIPIRPSVTESVVQPDIPQVTPLYVGVPFPQGVLKKGDPVRVIDEQGNEVPSFSRVMALWPGTNQVRWLGVDFQGNPQQSYQVVRGQPMIPEQRIQLKQQDEDFWVDTGRARYHVPATGALIGQLSVWQGEDKPWRVVIENSMGDDLYVVDQNGREGIAGRDQEHGQLSVEHGDSPLHVTLRREGEYIAEDGTRLAKHITRIHFHAGEVGCRIEHTLVLTEDTEQLWLSDYGVRFRYANGVRAKEVLFPADPEDRGERLRYSLQEYPHVSLLQSRAFWLSRMDLEEDCLFEIKGVNAESNPQNLYQGKLAGDWMVVNTDSGGFGVTLRKLWQHYPKELAASPNMLRVHLWSGNSGNAMDMRLASLVERVPKDWLNEEYHGKEPMEAFFRTKANGVGVARTHEILFSPLNGSEAGDLFIDSSRLFSEKVVFYPDPWWLRESEAMGRFHPYDSERFPDEEGFMESWFDQYHEVHQAWGNYGFLDYGAGPHVWYKKPNDGPLAGQWIPFLNRYSRKDYGYHAHLWRMFVRSGMRKYFDAAEKYTRHRLEVVMNHVDWKGKIKGTYQAFPAGPIYWGTRSSFHNDSGTDIRSFAYLYYTTDYRLAREMLGHYGEALKRVWNSEKQGPIRGTRPFASLKNIATVYQETGDPELKEIMEIQTEWLADLEAPQGVDEQRELTHLAKYGVKSGAMHRVWEISGNETAGLSMLKGATTYASTSLGSQPFTYFNAIIGEQVAGGWHLTHDPMFARTLLRDMRLAVTHYQNPDGSWKQMYDRYPVAAANVYPLGGMAFAMDALYDFQKRHGHMPDLPPFARQAGFGRKVLVAFEKPEGQPVRLDVRSRGAIAPVVYDALGQPIDSVRAVPFTDQLYSREPLATRYELEVPAELPEGVYLLDSGSNGEMWEVTWTDAEKIVMAAPGGMVMGPGGRSWGNRIMPATPDHLAWVYFHVPVNARLFQIFSSGKSTLRTSEGTLISIGEEDGFERVRVPEGMNDSLWAIRADESSFVQWVGLPDWVAYGQAERFFTPDISKEVLSALGLDFAQRGQLPIAMSDTGYGFEEESINGSQGVVLTDRQFLILESGKSGVSSDQWIQPQRGTIEFWLRPINSSVYQFGQSSAVRTLLDAGSWSIQLHRYGEMSLTVAAAASKDSPIKSRLEYNAGMVLENDRWNHIAIQWEAERGKNFWQVFINGRSADLLYVPDESGSREAVGDNISFLAETPGERIVVGANSAGRSALNGILAGLRFSNAPRYHQNFIPDPKETMRVDSMTLALFPFGGNLESQGEQDGEFLRAKWNGQ